MVLKSMLMGGGLPKRIITRSGRLLYRHESNLGTVIEFYVNGDSNNVKKVLILDAKYRSIEYFGLVGLNCPSQMYKGGTNTNGTWFLLGGNSGTTARNVICTDNTLYSLWKNCYDMNIETNCDFYMQYTEYYSNGITGCPAVQHVRSISVPILTVSNTIEYKTCNLPTFTVALRIWVESYYIDRMDPTSYKSSGSALKLRKNNIWTSSPYSSDLKWNIHTGSGCNSNNGNYLSLSIPIIEI